MNAALPVVHELSREDATGPYGTVVLTPLCLDTMGSMTAMMTNLTGRVIGPQIPCISEFSAGEWIEPPPGDDVMHDMMMIGIASGNVGYVWDTAGFRVNRAYRITATFNFLDDCMSPQIPVAATFVLLNR